MELATELFAELFSGWSGVLSFLIIIFMLGMGGFFLHLFFKKDGA